MILINSPWFKKIISDQSIQLETKPSIGPAKRVKIDCSAENRTWNSATKKKKEKKKKTYYSPLSIKSDLGQLQIQVRR